MARYGFSVGGMGVRMDFFPQDLAFHVSMSKRDTSIDEECQIRKDYIYISGQRHLS
jgi:hypothetical protein